MEMGGKEQIDATADFEFVFQASRRLLPIVVMRQLGLLPSGLEGRLAAWQKQSIFTRYQLQDAPQSEWERLRGILGLSVNNKRTTLTA
jgi:hypothetical protein